MRRVDITRATRAGRLDRCNAGQRRCTLRAVCCRYSAPASRWRVTWAGKWIHGPGPRQAGQEQRSKRTSQKDQEERAAMEGQHQTEARASTPTGGEARRGVLQRTRKASSIHAHACICGRRTMYKHVVLVYTYIYDVCTLRFSKWQGQAAMSRWPARGEKARAIRTAEASRPALRLFRSWLGAPQNGERSLLSWRRDEQAAV